MSERAGIQVTFPLEYGSIPLLTGEGLDLRPVVLIHLSLHPFTGLPQELFPQVGVFGPFGQPDTLARVLVKFFCPS